MMYSIKSSRWRSQSQIQAGQINQIICVLISSRSVSLQVFKPRSLLFGARIGAFLLLRDACVARKSSVACPLQPNTPVARLSLLPSSALGRGRNGGSTIQPSSTCFPVPAERITFVQLAYDTRMLSGLGLVLPASEGSLTELAYNRASISI